MIRKLRRNIILINELFVGIVLLAILAVFCVNNYISLHNSLERSLSVAAERGDDNMAMHAPREIGKKEPAFEPDNMNINEFVIVGVDKNGDISDVYENNATIDQEIINDVIEIIVYENNNNGEIGEYNLMYAKHQTTDGYRVALADTSSIYSTLMNNIFICLGLLSGGLIVIFIISLGLSYFAVKPVKTAWQQQKQFVADASHELKTPLTVILANNNILMSHKNATIAEEKKWLESTDEEAKHMKKLIDQMLFLAKSDAGQTRIEMTEVNISEIVEGTLLNFEPVAYEKNVIIDYNIDADITIKGDNTMITQLVHILVDNAVKYAGDNGNVTVFLCKTADICKLIVKNSGEVINSEDLPHLFDRFYRADKARSKGGYGLGLSIADDIVRKMNGKIEVESSEADGTTFNVFFHINS